MKWFNLELNCTFKGAGNGKCYESFGVKRAYNEPALSNPKYKRYDVSVKNQFAVSLVYKVTRLFEEC
jgi:hypothetical protein